MNRNEYYCYIDEKKLTEAEWEEVHKNEVENGFEDEFGYWHCDTYALYSKAFDEHMAYQIERREQLRRWYVRLMKAEFNDEWVESLDDFCETFHAVYGRSVWFRDSMLAKKGKTRKDLTEAWERITARYAKEA